MSRTSRISTQRIVHGAFVAIATLIASNTLSQETPGFIEDKGEPRSSMKAVRELLKNAPKSERRLISVLSPQGGKGPGLLGSKPDEVIAIAATPSDAAWKQALHICDLVFKHEMIDPRSIGAAFPARALAIKVGVLELKFPVIRNPEHRSDTSLDIEKELKTLIELMDESNSGKPVR